jgi:hypothetical protein
MMRKEATLLPSFSSRCFWPLLYHSLAAATLGNSSKTTRLGGPAPESASGTATTTAPAIIRCSYSISSAIWNAARFVPATFTAPTWENVLKPVVARYRGKVSCIYFRADAGFANPDIYEYLEAEGVKYVARPTTCAGPMF